MLKIACFMTGFLRRFAILSYSVSLSIFITFLISATPAKAQVLPAGFSLVPVANGISNPTTMTFAPDGRLFVAQQTGQLRIIKNGVLLAQPFITLNVNSSGERGLLGIAFDPSFSSNHYVYLYYTLPSAANNRISRFTTNGDIAVPGSEVVVLNLDPLSSATNHNGGSIHFGKDGKLYVAVGENAHPANAQNLDTYLGKILRINADGSVPAGNPFTTGSEQRKRVWEYGMRNPFTFSIQPVTGRIFVNDVGQDTWEEVNDCTSGGHNYGWPNAEGMISNPLYTNPVYTYKHGSGIGLGCAITGGTFFNPAATNYPSSYTGKYFFLDYCGNWIDMLTLSGTSATRSNFASSIGGSNVAMATGPDGNLYFLSRANSAVYKITYTTSHDTLTPVADAYVRAGPFSGNNYGSSAVLNTKKTPSAYYSREAYLRFDISSFMSGIASAKLRLYGSLSTTANASVPVEVHNVTNVSWLEDSITWNNKPTAETTVVATKTITGTQKQYYEWDITQLLASLRNAGINSVTLKLLNTDITISPVGFNSKEATLNKPQLVVLQSSSSARPAGNSIVSSTEKVNEEVNLSIYPNPAQGNFNVVINNYGGACTVRLHDLNGRLIKEYFISSNDLHQVHISNLKIGVYIVSVENGKNIKSKKIIIEK